MADYDQMDGIVTSILPSGFFVDCGSLQAFVGRNVRILHASLAELRTDRE